MTHYHGGQMPELRKLCVIGKPFAVYYGAFGNQCRFYKKAGDRFPTYMPRSIEEMKFLLRRMDVDIVDEQPKPEPAPQKAAESEPSGLSIELEGSAGDEQEQEEKPQEAEAADEKPKRKPFTLKKGRQKVT